MSDGIVGKIDRAEHKRVMDRFKSAKASRITLHDANDAGAPEATPVRGRVSRSIRRSYPRSVSLGLSVLGFSSAQVAGDFVIQNFLKRQEFEAQQGAPVTHVRNGKPLTAKGAKMLGVSWPV